jgi:transposase InsO family protein
VLDDCTRENLCIEVSTGFSGAHVARVLERLCQQRQVPEVIRSDNGPEFTRDAVQSWAKRRGLRWHCIEPGKPTQNSHIERFNGRLRDECLNQNLWQNIEEVRQETAAYRRDDNPARTERLATSRLWSTHEGLHRYRFSKKTRPRDHVVCSEPGSRNHWIEVWGLVIDRPNTSE